MFGRLPFGVDPSLQFQPFERRIQRTTLDVEDVIRIATNCLRDSIAVKRLENQGAIRCRSFVIAAVFPEEVITASR